MAKKTHNQRLTASDEINCEILRRLKILARQISEYKYNKKGTHWAVAVVDQMIVDALKKKLTNQ